jgi:NAD(P)-dependent dehydrogenase (short-subunit alcohol dehydrogenase family)
VSSIRKALITGGNGYIGSVLLRRLLQDGVEVHALANRNRERLDSLLPSERIHCVEGESKFFSDIVRNLEPDAIFHLASIHVEPNDFDDMIAMVETNIRIGTALLHGAAFSANRPVFLKYRQLLAVHRRRELFPKDVLRSDETGVPRPDALLLPVPFAARDDPHFVRQLWSGRSTP